MLLSKPWHTYAAKDWGKQGASDIIEQIKPHLDDAELNLAEIEFQKLNDAVIIDHTTRGKYLDSETERRKPIKRAPPRYPESLALSGMHDSWARYLIAKEDLDTMAWYGIRLITDAKDPEVVAEGRKLITRAAEAGHPTAKRLLDVVGG